LSDTVSSPRAQVIPGSSEQSIQMSDVPQDDWSLPDHFIKSVVCCHPFLSKNVPIQFDYKTAVLSALQSNTSPVDISCCTEGESFCGNPIHREKVDMKIADFTAAWIAYGNQQQHWALELDLNLYLSQCCFSSPGEPTTCDIDPSCISLPLPPVLCNEGVSNNQSNLWMNIQPARSTLHYDASHNLLLLLTGRKVVTLLSPSCTPYLQPVSASDANPNHSRLSFCEVEALVNDRYRSDAGLDHTDCFLYRAVMDAGDALFIPEGWWHQVESEQCSMAVNFWFSLEAGADCTKVAAAPGEDGKGSAISQASNTSVDMRPYKLRKLVHEMVRDALSENSAALAPLCGSDLAFQYSADLAYESFETALLSLLSDGARVSTESDGQLLFNGSNVDGVSGQCRNERKRGAAAIAPADLPHSSSSPEQRWLAFVSASVHEQRRLWLPFANKVCNMTPP
jgi:hypothetical protein